MNYKNKYSGLLILLFLICSKSVTAQQHTIHGTVQNDSTYLQVVNVLNMSKMQGTVTDKKGSFTIVAAVGDSILFSSLVYVNRIIVITDTHVNSDQMTVYLEPDFYQLEAVTLDPRLKIDYGNIYVPKGTVFDEDALTKKKGPDSRKLTDPTSRGSGINIIGVISNLLQKGRIKRKKQRQEDLKREIRLKVLPETLIRSYGEAFFTNWLKIPKDEVYLFLEYCETQGMADYMDQPEFQMVNFLVKQSKAYKLAKK